MSAKSISTTSHTFNNIQFTDFSESIKNLRAMNPDIKIRDDPVVAKLDTSVFKSIFTKNLVDLVDIFKKYNYEIRIAGGAVRYVQIFSRYLVSDYNMNNYVFSAETC